MEKECSLYRICSVNALTGAKKILFLHQTFTSPKIQPMTLLFDLISLEGLIIIILAIFVVFLLVIRDKQKERLLKESEKNRLASVDDVIAQYGDPDQIVVVNPTRGNDTEGTVLEFKSKNILFINGFPIEKQHVKDVSFSNFANAYLPNDYKVIIITDIAGQDIIHIPLGAGNDAHYANEVVKEIKSLL